MPVGPFVPNTTILSADVNDDLDDIALALTGSVAANGETPMTGAIQAFAGTLALPGITWTTDFNTGRYHPSADAMTDVVGGVAVAEFSATGVNFPLGASTGGVAIMPPGVMLPYGGAAAPTGWLLCFGQSVLRADFPALFTAIGTAYGAADGTHFNIPDLRGRVPAGKDDMGGSAASRLTNATMTPNGITLAAVGGAQIITLAQANLPNVSLDTQLTSGAVAVTDSRTFSGSKASSTAGVAGASDAILQSSGSNATLTGISVSPSGSISGTVSNLNGFTSTLSGGVGQTATDKMQPSIITNYIIKT